MTKKPVDGEKGLDSDLQALLDQSKDAPTFQLELTRKKLDDLLHEVIVKRVERNLELKALWDEHASLDGEFAVKTGEIAEMEAGLLDIVNIINNLRSKKAELNQETKQIKKEIGVKIKEQTANIIAGQNRLEKVQGALIDLFAENMVLKASFLAYAASLKGMSRKTRITREINEQTKELIRDTPVLKSEIQQLRDRLTQFKTEAAQANVQMRDKLAGYEQDMFATAKEHKYLVKLYEEEAQVLQKLDSEVKVQLESAMDVANRLIQEITENEAYFKAIGERLHAAVLQEKKFSIFTIGKKLPPIGAPMTNAPTAVPEKKVVKMEGGQVGCPKCEVCSKWCPACRLKNTKPKAEEILVDCQRRRAGLLAQTKFIRDKIHQLEIEVYISKMNVEIQMLQTSINIESWKKTGAVPPHIALSGIDGEKVEPGAMLMKKTGKKGAGFSAMAVTTTALMNAQHKAIAKQESV